MTASPRQLRNETDIAAALQLREELDLANARAEEALKASEDGRARFLDKAREEAEAREEIKGLRSRVEELQGDWVRFMVRVTIRSRVKNYNLILIGNVGNPDLVQVLVRSNTC